MPHKAAISTVSLGWHETHTIDQKLFAIKQAGFNGVELFIWDIELLQRTNGLTKTEAAQQIRELATSHDLEIIGVGPLMEFEAQPTSLESRISTAKQWIAMAQALGTDLIQIPTAASKDVVTSDEDIIVRELRLLADLGAAESPPIRFALEALGWGKNAADWEESLRYVRLVDRANFGLCIDTYHILGRVWADFRSPTGRRNGGDAALRDSLQRFKDFCPPEKIFYVQLSDAEKLKSPILPGHPAYNPGHDDVESMCFYGRLFPMEEKHGAYFPIRDILTVILRDIGWEGWCSMEAFHRDMKGVENGPQMWAKRGWKSWMKVLEVFGKE